MASSTRTLGSHRQVYRYATGDRTTAATGHNKSSNARFPRHFFNSAPPPCPYEYPLFACEVKSRLVPYSQRLAFRGTEGQQESLCPDSDTLHSAGIYDHSIVGPGPHTNVSVSTSSRQPAECEYLSVRSPLLELWPDMSFVRRCGAALIRNLGVLRTPIVTNPSVIRVGNTPLPQFCTGILCGIQWWQCHTWGHRLAEGISLTQATPIQSDPKCSRSTPV
jgi:hypothetical protein